MQSGHCRTKSGWSLCSKGRATTYPRNHVPEYLCNINGIVVLKTDMGTPLFITAIFAIAKTQSTIDRWGTEEKVTFEQNRMVFIVKKILTFAAIWTKLQNFMLSAMRQTLNKHCVIHKQEILQKLLSRKEKVEWEVEKERDGRSW